MNIGIVGCGNISETYFECQKIFNNFKIVACADINNEAASNAASKYNVKALSVDEILENNEIDLIINLTIPAAPKNVSGAQATYKPFSFASFSISKPS